MNKIMDDQVCFLFETFLGFRYIVAKPNQYLAITGAGFDNDIGIYKSYHWVYLNGKFFSIPKWEFFFCIHIYNLHNL